ncbi:MAG: MotA/TolQ/ExbB proton channel family protein [Halieaceae bacterium]|jgi:biopolymer transport protein ExbB|nr:MotA/TolQ/ExbB proton channel family protein [Halieaceae bacterium]
MTPSYLKRGLLLLIFILGAPAWAQDSATAGDSDADAAAVDEAIADTEDPVTLEGLLEAVRSGRLAEGKTNQQRLAEFRRERAKRDQMLKDILAEERRQEEISAQREAQFELNEAQIGELEERLKERMGSLQELFGVLQQVSSDAQAQFYNSLTQLEYPERTDFLLKFASRMGKANRLPALSEIETLWFELQREMVESGRIVTRSLPVVSAEGVEEQRPVTRVGLFNAVSDGKFLQYIPETGRLIEFARQPDSRYLQGPQAFDSGAEGYFPFAIDPVRGQLLQILTQAPNLRERVGQGGVIGYIIIAIGIFGVLLAVYRFVVLGLESRRIRKQLADLNNPRDDNALGRILKAYHEDRELDIEALELKMGESVLREVPNINRSLPLLKIIAAVAPLMGLLGTVTGMIITFQAITLFGAGDPRLMAGGISQALITTVLGLTVAIPTLLLHNVVQGRATALTDILQHEAVAVVAARAEQDQTA